MNYLPFTKPTLDEATIQGVVEVLRSGWLATGPNVQALEKALSDYLGGRTVRTLTSATGGLEVALQVCGIGPGDEVITPAMSFAATPNVIMRVGAKPVFVDVDLVSRNIDLNQVEAAITPRTKAIMPVHFAGLPVDMDALYDIAQRHKLRVIEDAAHAIGSSWQGKRIGSFGDIVSFSFHPNKNMTTIEGGALSFADADEVKKFDLLRFHGISRDAEGNMDVSVAGGKYNLSDVAARVGVGQLPLLNGFNAKRRELVAHYFKNFASDPAGLLPARGDEGHSWHMFAPLLPLNQLNINRKQFIDAMHQHGLGVGIHYPALHLFSLYCGLGYKEGDFPNAERIGRETVTLPLFPTMELADVERVCAAAKKIIETAKK
ncbi:MAG: DegT/DnrJ/EryC1/StrS aminotransferase family protein [Gammaproteobacteria bacterium]|nr:DegT/DnrJ/EryC1/StrS aminotransferase family protein [Gammaproteobacteria bacterium]MBU1980396.1 DegT/DnrJ/EryC1/StrS aminotransferase family protein [Gammaproteobacteria bacterium]